MDEILKHEYSIHDWLAVCRLSTGVAQKPKVKSRTGTD
jgi:hypothetical protein